MISNICDFVGLCGIIWDYVGLKVFVQTPDKRVCASNSSCVIKVFLGNARTIDKSRLVIKIVNADLNASLKGASEQNTTQELEREHFTQENISKQEEYFTFTKHKHNTTQGEIIKTEPERNGFAIVLFSNQILHMN